MDKLKQLQETINFITKDFVKKTDVIPLLKELITRVNNSKKDAETVAMEVCDDTLKKFKAIADEVKTRKGEKGDKGDSIVGPKGADGKNGKDGKEGKPGKDGKNGKDGLNGSPDSSEEIVDKINALPIKSEYQIGKEHIKDLEDSLKKMEEMISNIPRGGGARSGNSVQYYDISGELDGSTKSFNIPTNRRVLQVIGSSFPFNFRPLIDYTVSGKTLTFTSQIDETTSLASGQTITVLYVGMFNTI